MNFLFFIIIFPFLVLFDLLLFALLFNQFSGSFLVFLLGLMVLCSVTRAKNKRKKVN